MANKNTIQYIFLHLDGVILENILAPITRNIIKKLGGEYTAEVENNIFARSQIHAANYLKQTLNLSHSLEEIIQLYYSERKKYESENSIRLNDGLEDLLKLLKSSGYKIVSYGGAPKDYFLKNINGFLNYFDDEKYIQTKDIRPGVKEITQGIYNLRFQEVLFIDEERTVAEAAKHYNAPFIGVASNHEYSFQKMEMEKIKVRYIVNSLSEINTMLLSKIEIETKLNLVW
ncbi:MAG TPA: hypothetical protein PLX69_10490 [Leptospiraceae bacterium]|nr:hypothetical protein [Leptospiraceae bacterium]